MFYKIDKILAVTVGEKPVTVPVHGQAFLLQNLSHNATVFYKDKDIDGKNVKAADGFAVGPEMESRFPMVASELSIVADKPGTDVRVMILELG